MFDSVSVSDRSGPSRPPAYCRQKRKGKPDAAYVRINRKRFYLGLYGSEKSKEKYAELIKVGTNGSLVKAVDDVSEPEHSCDVSHTPTIAELLAAFLDHVDEYYGHKSPEWYHQKSESITT